MKSFSSNQLFILLAAVTIALFALVTMEEARPRPASPAPVLAPPAAELAPEPEPQDETENLPRDEVLRGWRTYRNEEFGFEVKYPANWLQSESLECAKEAPDICQIGFSSIPPQDPLGAYVDDFSIIIESPTPTDIEQRIQNFKKSSVTVEESIITVGGFSARRFNYSKPYFLYGKIIIERANRTYILSGGNLSFVTENVYHSDPLIFDQILSTFWFLE